MLLSANSLTDPISYYFFLLDLFVLEGESAILAKNCKQNIDKVFLGVIYFSRIPRYCFLIFEGLQLLK